GPEDRIGNGVSQHIGIGMAFEAELRRDRHAAEDQRAPRHNPVHIPALPDPNAQRRAASCSKNSLAMSMSPGRVILMLRSLPKTTLISVWSSRSTRLDSSVPAKPSARAASIARLSTS